MSRIPLFKGYYLGTGLISVVGTSFATLSTASAVRRTSGFIIQREKINVHDRTDFQCNVQRWNVSVDYRERNDNSRTMSERLRNAVG